MSTGDQQLLKSQAAAATEHAEPELAGSRAAAGDQAASFLQLRDVVKRYGPVTAVDGVSITVHAGEIFALLGPSGCGKSTTLRVIAGLEEVDEGQVLVGGNVVADGRAGTSVPPEKRNMGMVFQSYAIWPHMTVFENVAFPLRLRRVPAERRRRRVHEILSLTGLDALAGSPATRLSGGQQQRVALARALVYEPTVLLLDEPLSNLDPHLREDLRREIARVQAELELTIVLVTHDRWEAMALADRLAILNQGKVEQVGTPREVYERPATPFARDFLGPVLSVGGRYRTGGSGAAVDVTGPAGEAVTVSVTGPVAPGLEPGGLVVLACRPEATTLHAVGNALADSLPATVVRSTYQGGQTEHLLAVCGGEVPVFCFEVDCPHPPGSAVRLQLDPARVSVSPGSPT